MTSRYSIFVLWIAVVYAAPAMADRFPLPDRFSVAYSLSQGGVDLARLERKGYRVADERYVIESVAKPVGIAAWILRATSEERSEWRLVAGRVVPLKYFYRESGRDRNREMELIYDWEKRIAVDRKSGKRWQLPSDAQDQTSIQFAIMEALRRGEKEFHFSLLDGERIRFHRYRVMGKEILDTELGRVEVIEVKEIREPGKRHSVFWCAPRYAYLPMRVEQRKRGSIPLVTVIEELKGFPRQEVAWALR